MLLEWSNKFLAILHLHNQHLPKMQIKLENKMAPDEIEPPAELPANTRRGGCYQNNATLPELLQPLFYCPKIRISNISHFYQFTVNEAIQLQSQRSFPPPLPPTHFN